MIMVIGGRCQGKSSFAREHIESRIQENKKIEKDGEIQKDHMENLKTDPWKHPPGKNFLLPPGAGIFTCWYAGF